MTAHELARALLEMPDVPVEIYDHAKGCWRDIVDLSVEHGQGEIWIDINVDIQQT